MHIEYSSSLYKKRAEERKEPRYWRNFSKEISLDRNYLMFGLLSQGVRVDLPEGFTAKGLPTLDELALETRMALCYMVDDELYEDGHEGYIKKETAQSWVEDGSSTYMNSGLLVTSPDYHSHSWMTTEEFEIALENYRILKSENLSYRNDKFADYKAVLAVMKTLQENDNDVRIVFWFDN